MTWLLTAPLLALCLLGAAGSALAAALDRRPPNALLVALLGLEVLTVVQLVVAVVAALGADRVLVFLLYAALLPFVVPVGVFWSAAEKSRSSTLVITVACCAVAVMTARMLMLWSGRAPA